MSLLRQAYHPRNISRTHRRLSQNPEAVTICVLCGEKYKVKESQVHKNICVPFLHEKIVKLESEKAHLENEIDRLARRKSTARYILTWNGTMPTPENHHRSNDDLAPICFRRKFDFSEK